MTLTHSTLRTLLLGLMFALIQTTALAQAANEHTAFNGSWVLNKKLSEDTDERVERAIRDAGGRPDGGNPRQKGERYRGGPPEQALYDHISYEPTLEFSHADPEFRLKYGKDFERVFYSDNRSRVVSASGTSEADRQDYSFASWDGDKLLVETRPRDGGWINETFEILPATGQLKVTLELEPSSFGSPIQLVRIYDRANPAVTDSTIKK